MKLKITTIGNSAGVILPKELLARLRLEKGDELFALETPDGIKLTVFDPELAAQMEVAEKVMREDRAVLHKLAERQITSVLLEAGARLNAAAVEMNLVDKVWLFYAARFLGEAGVPLLAPYSEGPAGLPPLLRYRLHRYGPDFAVEGTLRDVYRDH